MISSLILSRYSEILSLIPVGTYKILSFLIVFVIIYITQFYYRYFNRPNPLPGPVPLPIFGNAHQTIGCGFNDWLLLMHKKYGDIYEVYLGGRIVVVCRADLVETMNVTSTKTKYFVRFKHTEGCAEYGLDNSSALIFGNNRKSWRYNRQFFSQVMMTPSFSNQAIEWTNELWKEMETCWVNAEDRELDLSKWMTRFTNDIIFRITTGVINGSVASYNNKYFLKDNDFLNEEKEKMDESENLIQAIKIYMKGISYYMIFNWFMRHYVPFIREKGKSLLKNRDYLFNRLYKIVEERKIEIDNTPLDQPLRHDMLTSFITANTSRDINTTKKNVDAEFLRPMTDKEIVSNIHDAMLGGTDSTANLFCFIVYCLGKHPEVKQRLQQELDEVFGKDSTKSITYNDIEQLEYCDAVIKEVTRHYPVVFLNGRVSSEDDNIGGYNLSAGSEIFILYSAIMKRKDYWTDPENFDPNRFYKIEGSDKYTLEKQNIKNTFTIFGDGLRKCPGRKLAMIELKFLLASIYRKYDVELVDINAPLNYVTTIIGTCEELLVKMKPRKF